MIPKRTINRREASQVYFLRPVDFPGPIKIGCSPHPKARLGSLMAWSPLRLELAVAIPGGRELERNIQECFVDSHSHLEWFHASPRLLKAIEDLRAGVPVEQAIDLSARKGNLYSLKRLDTERRRGTSTETYAL